MPGLSYLYLFWTHILWLRIWIWIWFTSLLISVSRCQVKAPKCCSGYALHTKRILNFTIYSNGVKGGKIELKAVHTKLSQHRRTLELCQVFTYLFRFQMKFSWVFPGCNQKTTAPNHILFEFFFWFFILGSGHVQFEMCRPLTWNNAGMLQGKNRWICLLSFILTSLSLWRLLLLLFCGMRFVDFSTFLLKRFSIRLSAII